MSKCNIKTNRDPIRSLIIKKIIAETGLSEPFIRQAIKGQKTTPRAEDVKKDYIKRYSQFQNAIN